MSCDAGGLAREDEDDIGGDGDPEDKGMAKLRRVGFSELWTTGGWT